MNFHGRHLQRLPRWRHEPRQCCLSQLHGAQEDCSYKEWVWNWQCGKHADVCVCVWSVSVVCIFPFTGGSVHLLVFLVFSPSCGWFDDTLWCGKWSNTRILTVTPSCSDLSYIYFSFLYCLSFHNIPYTNFCLHNLLTASVSLIMFIFLPFASISSTKHSHCWHDEEDSHPENPCHNQNEHVDLS